MIESINHLLVNVAIGGQNVAALHIEGAVFQAGNATACLRYYERAGCYVPGRELAFPEAVESA
jgi:hypothetical protein